MNSFVSSFVFAMMAAQSALASFGTVPPSAPMVEPVNYVDPLDNHALQGFVSIPDITPAPAVVIIPDWSNVDEYEKLRATMMSQDLGYVGFAADIYGAEFGGVEDFAIRREQAGKYRSNETLFSSRIQAAVDVLKNHPDVMPDKIAVIGYCGTGILTYSFMGATDVVGAVSFHGGLTNFTTGANITHPILVLSGGDDDTGTEVEDLEFRLNQANANWQITRFSQIEHAFTVWGDNRYSARADERSWQQMASFLEEAFGFTQYGTPEPASTNVQTVTYNDNGFSLTGYLSIPQGAVLGETPAAVIVPDWDGVSLTDGYEAKRATMLSELGYVAFVADVFGSNNTQVPTFEERGQLTTYYRSNPDIFVSRIQAAVDLVASHELVNASRIGMVGYCFGGTGVVNYAFAGLQNVQVVVPMHGGLTSTSSIMTDVVYPYVLVESGGVDDAHGNNTVLEESLNGANTTWEISRYSNVDHGFTSWGGRAYNARADSRSWESMLHVFNMVLGPVMEDATGSSPTTTTTTTTTTTSTTSAGASPSTATGPTATSDGTLLALHPLISGCISLLFLFCL